MPILVSCNCGASLNLKDEFAVQKLKCPTCQQTIAVAQATAQTAAPTELTPPPLIAGEPAFSLDRYLMRQKVMSINQKYEIGDEQNRPVLFVERPAHLGRQLLAVLGGLLTGGRLHRAGGDDLAGRSAR
jgi:hypothetical protein